jgi:hypothetical protein
VLAYLLRHWPVTHSPKTIMFLAHCIVTLSFIDFKGREYHLEKLFLHVRGMVWSPNFKVAAMGLEICRNQRFISNMAHLFPSAFPPLVEAVSAQREHWSEHVRDIAAKAFPVIASIAENLPRLSDPGEPFQPAWMAIAEQAQRAGWADETGEFEERLTILA